MDQKSRKVLLDFFNMLLEAERAGVKVLGELVPQIEDRRLEALVRKFLRDEGVNCRILTGLIHELDAEPSDKTGSFADKVRALEGLNEKIDLLIRGQAWVARKISAFRHNLPAGSAFLFLAAIKSQHDENVAALKAFVEKRGEQTDGR